VATEPSDEGRFAALHLSGTARVADLLTQLYVLIPALDREKHYWVGEEEVAKLLSKGGDWLPTHPEREAIVSGYLEGRRALVADAMKRLQEENARDPEEGSGRIGRAPHMRHWQGKSARVTRPA
jgi:hypothetical protein